MGNRYKKKLHNINIPYESPQREMGEVGGGGGQGSSVVVAVLVLLLLFCPLIIKKSQHVNLINFSIFYSQCTANDKLVIIYMGLYLTKKTSLCPNNNLHTHTNIDTQNNKQTTIKTAVQNKIYSILRNILLK